MDGIQILALILVLAGAAIPGMFVVKLRRIKKFQSKAMNTTAIVTHSEKRMGLKGSVYYLIFIDYKDITGKVFSGHLIKTKNRAPGTAIPVMYIPADPAKYNTDFGKLLPWLIGISVMFFFLLLWCSYRLLT